MEKETNKKTRGCRGITDEQAAAEIARLNESEYVALARYEQNLKYARRQYLYNLRQLEKRGKALAEAGITKEMLKAMTEEYEGGTRDGE